MTAATTLPNHLALAYAPYIERSRAVGATRLTVFPLKPGSAPDAAGLLAAVSEVWPAEGAARVLLNVLDEPLLADLLRQRPNANVMIEVPAFMAADAAHAGALAALRERRSVLLVKGASAAALPREVLSCFAAAIAEPHGEHLPAPSASPGGLPRVQDGVRTPQALDAAFDGGAQAALGWPLGEAPTVARPPAKGGGASAMQVLVELMQRVDRGEPIERIEPTLRRDPQIAFRLLRYINSPAFGLRVEVSSFGHAMALLGRQRLKRWLALLLVTASDDPAARPVMYAAVRRGLLMEEFARPSGDDDMRGEMFLCGVFSLLDRMFQQPLGQLLGAVPLPERVVQTLVGGSGPYRPWLDLVDAVEGESLAELRAAAERVLLDLGEVNRALLRALAAAAQLG